MRMNGRRCRLCFRVFFVLQVNIQFNCSIFFYTSFLQRGLLAVLVYRLLSSLRPIRIASREHSQPIYRYVIYLLSINCWTHLRKAHGSAVAGWHARISSSQPIYRIAIVIHALEVIILYDCAARLFAHSFNRELSTSCSGRNNNK